MELYQFILYFTVCILIMLLLVWAWYALKRILGVLKSQIYAEKITWNTIKLL